MKKTQLFVIAVMIISAVVLIGCSKDNGTTNPTTVTDQQALQSQIVHSDSLANFLTAEEMSLDDSTYWNPEYGFGKVSTVVPVIQYGRHIFWNLAVRHYSTSFTGDTVAVVTVTSNIPGDLLLAVGSHSGSTVIIDSVIQKPFTEIVERKFRFKRIANTADPGANWRPVAMTLARGVSENTPSFHIVSLEFKAKTDTIITDPLNSWFLFGHPLHSGIPYVLVGDTVGVSVTLESTNDSAEVVNLRHGIDGVELARGRVLMHLTSSSQSGPGTFTRVYNRQFIARNFAVGHPLILVARFNALVDVFSYGTLHDDSEPYTNEFWGFPYIEIKR